MYHFSDEWVHSNKYSRQNFPIHTLSNTTSFWIVVNLVCHSLISMPPSPPPMYITYNQTRMIPCLLKAIGTCERVGTIFTLIIDRINFIVNLIGTMINNDI